MIYDEEFKTNAYTRSGYNQRSYEPSTCSHLDRWGDIVEIVNICSNITTRIECREYNFCEWNCVDTKDWEKS